MRRNLIAFSLVLLALAAGAAFGRGVSTALAASTHPNPQDRQVLEYPAADYVNVVSQQCQSDGTVLITLNWQSYNLGYQWIDLSLSNNGFGYGTFVGIGPVAPNANSQPWGGLLPGYTHYLRVNTLTQYGWYPSQTISFFTRNDCYYYQPPPPPPPPVYYDSDGDGIPNNQDACPNQYGYAAYNGCPTPQNGGAYPGGGQTGNMCAVGWCPGQPAPAQFCPSQPQILIFPPPAGGCVWVTRGANSTYYVGEQVTICWWVNQTAEHPY